jgi:hypothetical protein
MHTRLISKNGGVEYLFGEKASNKYWIETTEANQKHLGKAKTLLALLLKENALVYDHLDVNDDLHAFVFHPSFTEIDRPKMHDLIKSCNPQTASVVLPIRTKTGLMKQTGCVIIFKTADEAPTVEELFIELQEFVAKNTEWLANRENPIEADLFTLQSNFESTLSWGDFPCLIL